MANKINKNKNRVKAEQDLLELFSILDPTNKNTKDLQKKFDNLSNEKFEILMKRIDSDKELITLQLDARDDIKMENISEVFKIAEKLNVVLSEKLYYPDGEDVSVGESLILTVISRKMKQMGHDKNKSNGREEIVNPMTGQSTDQNKVTKATAIQMLGLLSIDNTNIVRELMGYRSNLTSEANKRAMQSLNDSNYISLDEVDPEESKIGGFDTTNQSFNTFAQMMITAGLVVKGGDNATLSKLNKDKIIDVN